MLRISLVGNFTWDLIHVNRLSYFCIGGPPSYASLSLLGAEDISLELLSNYSEAHDDFIKYLKERGIAVKGKRCSACDGFEIFGKKKRALRITSLGCEVEGNIESDALLVNGVSNEVSPQIISQAKESGVGIIYVDPQGFIRRRKTGPVEYFRNDELLRALRHVDYLKVNERELRTLTGRTGPAGIEALRALGARNIIYFRGNSIWFYGKDRKLELRIEPVNVFDGIGMGDIFDSGFLYGLLLDGPELGMALGHLATIARPERACILKAVSVRMLLDRAAELRKNISKAS
ncbi:MAG: carbohydrate kinase family protein [Nitrososphaeria archaeon]